METVIPTTAHAILSDGRCKIAKWLPRPTYPDIGDASVGDSSFMHTWETCYMVYLDISNQEAATPAFFRFYKHGQTTF
jgi:hypothetical protein